MSLLKVVFFAICLLFIWKNGTPNNQTIFAIFFEKKSSIWNRPKIFSWLNQKCPSDALINGTTCLSQVLNLLSVAHFKHFLEWKIKYPSAVNISGFQQALLIETEGGRGQKVHKWRQDRKKMYTTKTSKEISRSSVHH